MTSALSGIKVIDLCGMGPASLAATMLGDMGAEVLKIDAPPGSGGRGAGQGIFPLDIEQGKASPMQLALMASNRNKKNMVLNLKTKAGRNIFHKLAETTDVIMEGFRPGVMERLGVGYETIAKINPRIIFCSVSGYGQDGPYRSFPGHDANYIGMAGVLGLIGYSSVAPPVLPLNIVADLAVAVFNTAIGILLAICARERTGRGQLVDISMTDGVIALLTGVMGVGEYLHGGAVPRRGETMLSGNEPFYTVYQTKDEKYLTVCPIEPHFWVNLCQALGREDFIPHQFAQSPKKDDLLNELKQIFLTKTRDEWFELLTKADVPVGKVLDLDEVFSDPQVLHRQMVIEVDYPELGKMKQIGFSIKLSDTPGQIRTMATRPGQFTEEVLSALGYSQDEIEKLRVENVI